MAGTVKIKPKVVKPKTKKPHRDRSDESLAYTITISNFLAIFLAFSGLVSWFANVSSDPMKASYDMFNGLIQAFDIKKALIVAGILLLVNIGLRIKDIFKNQYFDIITIAICFINVAYSLGIALQSQINCTICFTLALAIGLTSLLHKYLNKPELELQDYGIDLAIVAVISIILKFVLKTSFWSIIIDLVLAVAIIFAMKVIDTPLKQFYFKQPEFSIESVFEGIFNIPRLLVEGLLP